jgi:hypothetical protein
MPMTHVDIAYSDFDAYARQALNSATRSKLRKKFAATANGGAIEMSVISDATPIGSEIYPLYRSVLERSKLQFERISERYFCEAGRRMPDKVRFFVWRRSGQAVAFVMCMLHGNAICAEYAGFDYSVALELHLYHIAVRDMISWAIANGYTRFRSSPLNYDPKLHLRHVLEPLDLYVRHTSAWVNVILKRVLPLLEPTRHDPILPKFPNYPDLWASRSTKLV